jgi:hypothetical protein
MSGRSGGGGGGRGGGRRGSSSSRPTSGRAASVAAAGNGDEPQPVRNANPGRSRNARRNNSSNNSNNNNSSSGGRPRRDVNVAGGSRDSSHRGVNSTTMTDEVSIYTMCAWTASEPVACM